MSIIAAGTTTTTALSSTGNTDGTLQFQVNGTTASVTLNTLGAIGVGSSPSYGTSGQVLTSGGSTTAPTWTTSVSSQWTTTGSNIYYTTGSVGIGTSTIGTTLVLANSDSSTIGQLRYARSVDTTYYWETGRDNQLTGDFLFSNASGGAKTERARITSGGAFRVGTTAVLGSSTEIASFKGTRGIACQSTGGAGFFANFVWNDATTGDNTFTVFATEAGGTTRGSVTYNRTGGLTAYNTTSDYRAKDISGPVTGSGALIDSIPVYMGTMKGATQERPMFIAHETPAYAHTGEKDAVDADGNPVYQQMDASALIPVMWAEIQSLRQRIKALEGK